MSSAMPSNTSLKGTLRFATRPLALRYAHMNLDHA